MNAAYGESVHQNIHCVAAEPHATIVRVSVTDGGQEVAYETAVLGRLRGGYRVLQMRSVLGTRIELCYLFIKISFGSEPNLWATPRQLRMQHLSTAARRGPERAPSAAQGVASGMRPLHSPTAACSGAPLASLSSSPSPERLALSAACARQWPSRS